MSQRETVDGAAIGNVSGPLSIVLRRVDAVSGLMIDTSVWRDAHEYHAAHARLHHLALHGWGISTGLDISVVDGQNAVRVAPGIGVDPDGRFIVVRREQTFDVTPRAAG